MATATVPYGTTQPPAVNLYQNVPSEVEYHALKRVYLGLLPPQQIIEICLSFEVHVPFHVRASVWPVDLKAAIAALRKQTTPNLNPLNGKVPFPADPPSTTSFTDTSQPVPDKPFETASSEPEQPISSPNSPSTLTQTALPTTGISPTPSITQPPYSHQPYGFPQQQASYPHAPYYSTPPSTTYNYPPYPTYPNPPATNYLRNANTTSTPLHQTVEAQLSAEDLPSYEDIIVEALMGCPDPEGSVPKNIFTWMSSRYPLQSNFRPSASQALQKAYKRGRFEKSSNGKYRLNPLWEGGSTTRRHTRRPQIKEQNQPSTPSVSTKTSPFTRAPLENKRATSATSTATGHSPYPGGLYPYTYPPPTQYPMYNHNHSPDVSGGAAVTYEDTGEGSDAWEAAQNILKAINFGSLIQIDREEPQGTGVTGNTTTLGGIMQDESTHPSRTVAKEFTDARPRGGGTGVGTSAVAIGAQDRAALQAQLALLAAQMAELADGGEDVLTHGLSTAVTSMPTIRVTKTNNHAEDDEDDGDMEMVDVPVNPDPLQT